jgi:hypothetical protein
MGANCPAKDEAQGGLYAAARSGKTLQPNRRSHDKTCRKW